MAKKIKIAKTVEELEKLLASAYGNKKIGYVPTMGALHDGHASLIKQSVSKCDITVCSIFVNPTQFNDASDLEKYPRTLAADAKLLKAANCDIVFTPGVKDIYPSGTKSKLKLRLGKLDKVLEGEFRPGHFKGVAQVVKRLLDIVKPTMLFMGQKDFQQFTIIQHMIDQLRIPTQLVVCPIKREKSGLAMSSRNVRLDKVIKSKADILYKTLLESKELLNLGYAPRKIEAYAMKAFEAPDFKPEYFRVVSGYDLQAIKDTSRIDYIVACAAVWAGDVRLIDNLILKSPKT